MDNSSRETRESLHAPRMDAVVVCGMGPVRLQNIQGSDRLFPLQPYNRINAIAAKLLASNGIARNVILSGWRSGSGSSDKREQQTSEGELVADTYDRARGKGVTPQGREEAGRVSIIDEQARTTFGNIIEALNVLDERVDGHWIGSFAVLSSRFHMPRIAEMIKAFGLTRARVLCAEDILSHFGYNQDKIYPERDFGYGKTYQDFENAVYESQPAGLQNLQDNPSYVTFELAAVTSPYRFWEMATNIKRYYTDRNVDLPPAYDRLPGQYDRQAHWDEIKDAFRSVGFSKHPYTEKEFSGEQGISQYKELAAALGRQTKALLAGE